MGLYLQLNSSNIVVSAVIGEKAPDHPNQIDATNRTDGPFDGKIYDSKTDTFSKPPAPAPKTAIQTSVDAILAKDPALVTPGDLLTVLKSRGLV